MSWIYNESMKMFVVIKGVITLSVIKPNCNNFSKYWIKILGEQNSCLCGKEFHTQFMLKTGVSLLIPGRERN